MAVKKRRRPNTKPVPSLVTLGAAAITCLSSFRNRVELGDFVTSLLIVVIVFLVFGYILKMTLDYAFKNMDDPTLIEQLESNVLEDEENEDPIFDDVSE